MQYTDGKSYYSLNQYLRDHFGEKLYKLALDGGMSCPNRDGTLDTRGCIFCSGQGSGDFAADRSLSVTEQINSQIRRMEQKRPGIHSYIAYFQAFTNTHAPVSYLRGIFTEAIRHPAVKVLSVATRPDCLEPEKIALLQELNQRKPVWVELGLQTSNDATAAYLRRGYPLSCFDDAVYRLREAGLETIVHVILGLPGESRQDLLSTIRHCNALPLQGIKLQLLHVLKGTDLANDYLAGKFETLEENNYIDLVIDCLEHLRPDMVIHRVTGDGPKKLLIAPTWSCAKRNVLNHLHREMKLRGSRQGKESI